MGHLIQKFFHALGGLTLWFWALFMNNCLHKNKRTDISYYLFEEFEVKKNTGFSAEGIRLVLGILTFILILILLDI